MYACLRDILTRSHPGASFDHSKGWPDVRGHGGPSGIYLRYNTYPETHHTLPTIPVYATQKVLCLQSIMTPFLVAQSNVALCPMKAHEFSGCLHHNGIRPLHLDAAENSNIFDDRNAMHKNKMLSIWTRKTLLLCYVLSHGNSNCI